MNTWFLSGEVIKVGIKGKQYPKLWIQLVTTTPKDSSLQTNKLFITCDSDANQNSKLGRLADQIQHQSNTNKFIFIHDAMMAKIQHSKKLDSGEWEVTELPGFKAKLPNISLSSERYPLANTGIVKAKATNVKYDFEAKAYKFILEEQYRTPTDNKWKTRLIPMYYPSEEKLDMENKQVFITASACGVTLTGESKAYGWANKLIILG